MFNQSLITLNETEAIKIHAAHIQSYTGCWAAKSSPELQSRVWEAVLFSLSPQKWLHIYLFQTNDCAHLKESAD